MSIAITTRRVEDVIVVEVKGRITLGEGSTALREALRHLVKEGHKKILVDLGEACYVDSSGIGELIGGSTNIWNHGGQIKLCHLTKRVRDLLQLTNFYTVWRVFDDETEAVRSFE